MFRKLISNFLEPKIPKFSLERLKQLFIQLSRHRVVTRENQEIVIETIRSIAELVVWGDQNDPNVWDFFLEKQLLHYFFYVLEQKTSSILVKKQIIQTLSIMIQNINTKNSLYFLLSNNKVNELIGHRFNFDQDDELLAYYITFLKTVSLRMDKEILQFFFDRENSTFLLYDKAIQFANSYENMVQIAVRTITLNIYSIQDETMYEYIRNSSDAYFDQISLYTREQFLRIAQMVKEHSMNIETICADQLDYLWYLNDVLQSPISAYIEDKLVPNLLNSAIIPLLESEIQMSVKLFIASQMLIVFASELLIDTLVDYLFDKWLPKDQLEQLFNQGHETEVSALLGVMFSMLTNRNVKSRHLDKIGLKKHDYTQDTSTDLNDIHIEFMVGSGSHIETKLTATDSVSTVESSNDSNIIWLQKLLLLSIDPRMEKIVSLHMISRIIHLLGIDLNQNVIQPIATSIQQNKKELKEKFDLLDVTDFINIMGLQYEKYHQLTNLRSEQMFSDPILMFTNPPHTVAAHSRPANTEDEQLAKLMHQVILWDKLVPADEETSKQQEELCKLGAPQVEGSHIPLPPTTIVVYSAPYFEFCATRDHKNRRYALVVEPDAVYFVDTVGCAPFTGKIAMAIPLLFSKVKADGDTKNMLRLTCSYKTSFTTYQQLCDQMIIFDDPQKCIRVHDLIQQFTEEMKKDRSQSLSQLLDGHQISTS